MNKMLSAIRCLLPAPPAPPEADEDDARRLRRTIHHLRAANQRLTRLAMVDDLTEAYNRRFLREALRTEGRRAARSGKPFSCMMIDCDHFKLINDTYGHVRGDAVLAELADLLKLSVKMTDVVARYGGEEFCVLMPETTMHQARVVAERLRRTAAGHLFGPRRDIRLTISIGLAGTQAGDVYSEDLLLRRADVALYRAKAAGRNRLVTLARDAAPPPPPARQSVPRRTPHVSMSAPQQHPL